jgi:uncharacterized caspase-like protein
MFGRIIGIGGVVASFVTCGMTSASAQSNVALVIGNSHYQHAAPLPTTPADADAIAETLRAAGYDVTPANDVRQSDFGLLLRIFLGKLAAGGSGTTGFFYYAGYAAQSDGQNYLVPVDAAITGAGDVAGQSFRLGELVDAFAGTPAGARIVVLDASYVHGFGRGGEQPVPPGLAPMSAPAGMMIASAAGPGEVAGAATGNSLFTHMVSRLARLPGLDLERVFKTVSGRVNQATNGSQTPWMMSALTTDVTLFAMPQPAAPAPPPAAATAPVPAPAVATTPASHSDEAKQPTKKEKQRAAERSRPRKAARTSPAESAPDAPPPSIPLGIGIGGIGIGIGGRGIGIGIGQ